jgi:hypothetical protein
MELAATRATRNAVETKSRILGRCTDSFLRARIFANRICAISQGVPASSHSLILRYFGTKANLFAEALNASFAGTSFHGRTKSGFGKQVVEGIDNPRGENHLSRMIALALGDDEARRIAATVMPHKRWIASRHGWAAPTLRLGRPMS